MSGKMLTTLVIRSSVWLGLMGVAMFLSAGSWTWAPGWAFLAIFVFGSIGFCAWLIRRDPALLMSRLTPLEQSADQPWWDKLFLLGFIAFWFVWLGLMAADNARWHLSPVPLWLQVVGGLLIVAGFAVTMPVFAANSFAAPVVRVQEERKQRVIDSGPYAWVRHPMYAAASLYLIGMPLMLGAWWGLIGTAMFMIGVSIRAIGEENKLKRELPGYADYMSRVRYRLVPGIF
jgi:protein-S-isoprenylcysteine O-methyltransferase Ste14